MRIRLGCVVAIVLSVLVAVATAEAQKKTLVVGLNQDPDILDPDARRGPTSGASSSRTCARSSTRSTRT